jgi:uncharacterized protein YyaL (SSP411 family)
VVRRLDPGDVGNVTLAPELAAMVTAQTPRAYVCAGQVCAAPVTTAAALAEALREFRA